MRLRLTIFSILVFVTASCFAETLGPMVVLRTATDLMDGGKRIKQLPAGTREDLPSRLA